MHLYCGDCGPGIRHQLKLNLKEGRYFRSGKCNDDSVFLNVVNRFENVDCEECEVGSSTSICSNSRRKLSVDPRSELAFEETRKSRLDRADSTVGG